MSWHVETELLERYANGSVDDAHAFSVEAHVLACGDCRGRMSGLVARERLERMWAEVEERLDAPQPTLVERLLLRAGVPDHVARLLAATPSLSLSWLGAVALSLAFAVLAAHESERGLLLFLALAPLLPLAGVAAAYGPGVDPAYEVGVASPMRGSRLLLLRASAVFATSVAVAGAAALTLPVLDGRTVAWLLPALGLTLASLALATFVDPLWAAGSVALLWIAGVLTAALATDDSFAAFGAPVQVVFVAVIAASAAVLSVRRELFDLGRNV